MLLVPVIYVLGPLQLQVDNLRQKMQNAGNTIPGDELTGFCGWRYLHIFKFIVCINSKLLASLATAAPNYHAA
ncbi:MAG: hypothetical protein ABSB19_19860 [Methylomonas sp.]|jgi:hypothetical protein